MSELHWIVAEDVTLKEALSRYSSRLGAGAAALAYTPRACAVAIVSGSSLTTPSGELDASEVFEARAFGADTELRWLNEDDGRGRAVLLADDPVVLRELEGQAEATEYLESLPNSYLLWGTRHAEPAPGWTSFAEARIGKIDVPIAGVVETGRACLRSVEYLGVDDEHGNVRVIDERLVGFGGEPR